MFKLVLAEQVLIIDYACLDVSLLILAQSQLKHCDQGRVFSWSGRQEASQQIAMNRCFVRMAVTIMACSSIRIFPL